MTKRLARSLLFAACVTAICLVSIGSAKAGLGPSAPVRSHLFCYMGHFGQPSGCITVITGGLMLS